MTTNRWRALLAALLLLHLAPIWWFPLVPSQDGPSHVYNARLLLELSQPENFTVRQVFALNPALHPNLLAHAILAGLQSAVSPELAEKLLVTLVVALLPLAFAWLRRGVDGAHHAAVFAGLLYANHKLVLLGFHAFSLGVGLALLALGCWWRQRGRAGPRGLAGLYALLALAWSAHFAAFAAALLAIAVCAAWRAALAARSDAAGALRALAVQAALLLPAGLVALYYLLGGDPIGVVRFPDAAKLRDLLLEDLLLPGFTRWTDRLAPLLLATLAAAAGVAVAARARRPPRLAERDALLVVAAIFAALFAWMPQFATGGGRINERMLLFALLFAFAWLPPLPRRAGALLGIALIALDLTRLGRLTLETARLQPELAAFRALAAEVPPHATLAYRDAGQRARAFPDGLRYVGPFRHADAYLARARDVALFDNYEITFPYFPIQAGEAPRKDPDFVLAWSGPEGAPPPDPADYELARHERDLVLWRRRAAPPDAAGFEPLSAGGERLRLEAPRAQWTPGSRGWLRLAPALHWPEGAPTPEAVGDARDRVFRADVAPGRWRVTLEPAAPPHGRFELDVIANDARVAEGALADAGATPPPLRFAVDAADGRILLVLHARGAAPWALRAITLERDG